jgi:predicted DNA-binding transcriptional regulator YafY
MIAMPIELAQSHTMRYGPAEKLLRLARHLAGTRTGLTLNEMAAEIQVGRRTAERMRDTLMAVFPQMECWDDDERVRRWRLPATAMVGMVDPKPELVAAVETTARECEARGDTDRAGLLRKAAVTMRAMARPEALRRAEPDIAALMEAEGIAMRPGPRPIIADGVLPTLRRAILGMQLVVIQYIRSNEAVPTTGILCPYGILYGGRGWLVGHVEHLPDLRLWRLDRIASVDLLDRGFQRREDFSLAGYAEQSFGVFQEEPFDVVLRFASAAAEDAATWRFHATQHLEWQADGDLVVRFRAGGAREMCWHLFTWGKLVTIVEPDGLRGLLCHLATSVAAKYRDVVE